MYYVYCIGTKPVDPQAFTPFVSYSVRTRTLKIVAFICQVDRRRGKRLDHIIYTKAIRHFVFHQQGGFD